MGKAQNDIEEFIYKICYQPIWKAVNEYISVHPTALNLSMSRIHYPDTAMLLDMLLEYATHIRIDEDSLFFDAIMSCTIELQQFDEYRGDMSGETSQWLIASCEAIITDKLETIKISSVKPWSKGTQPSSSGIAASKSIVPIIYRKDLDKEATAFLEKYYPEALEEPKRVPIEDIAKEKLGLNVIQGYRITDDFSIFGQICFSPGRVKIYDLFKTSEKEEEVPRGTILIDAYTYWQRNSGCVNNTIAHEVYHWHRHRLYAAIKHILKNEKFIACRCPAEMVYPDEKDEWTDEQRMEWQANNLAPRILMPIQTFTVKVDELYNQYRFDRTDTSTMLITLTAIADELADFYGVSRQSALIRMTETGYSEARSVLQAINEKDWHSYVSLEDVFYEYSTNAEFRTLLDSGRFKYVDGYVVINDENTSNLMKMVIPPSQTMPGKILMNAAYPLDGKEYAVHPQKKFFRRSFFTVITTSRIFPNMTPSRMYPWLNSQRNCRRSANTLSRTKRFTSSLRLIKTAGHTFMRLSPSKAPASHISAT